MNTDNLQIWGLRLELIGLIILLVGSLWQAKFSGWWDKQLPEWQYIIQEQVNISILDSLKDIAAISVVQDDDSKQTLAMSVRESTTKSIQYAINERNKRHEAMKNGQAALFSNIQNYLILIGAFLIIIGKWLSLKSVKFVRVEKHSNNPNTKDTNE